MLKQLVMEHAQEYGVRALTDADLLALLLSKGTVTERRKLLRCIQAVLTERGGLNGILDTEIDELFQYEFDEGTATRLRALLELARRLTKPVEKRTIIQSPEDVVALLAPDMRHLQTEQMRVLVLNTKNHVIANILLYQGTVDTSCLRYAEIFRVAIVRNCKNIILCHNHPSSDPTPSSEDIMVTKECVEAAKLLEINLLDHIVIGNPRYASLKTIMAW